MGDSTIIPKNVKGQPLQFKTAVAALNWLSKKGWILEPIPTTSTTGGKTFIMHRDNTTEKELSTMFTTK